MWLYDDKEFTDEMIGDNYGFVYQITHILSGKRYIGRKYFYSKRTLPPLKGKKRKRHVIKESNWKVYYGSCKHLTKEIKLYGKDAYKREIISMHIDKGSTNYHELSLQIHLNVLQALNEKGERAFYNDNIFNRFYQSDKYNKERIKLHEKYRNME